MGKSDWDKWTNTSSVDGMCAHTCTFEMAWMECVCSIHGNSNSAPGPVSDCETEERNINWVMMKSGVNISLKLFDIATNINGMTLLNPFVTAIMLNRSCIRAHSHPIFMLIFISYSSWKTTAIPFSCINSLSSVRFQYTGEHRLFHSIFRFLFGLCPISIYAICPLTSCKVCSKLMNNLWIDWNRLSFNEYGVGGKELLHRKDNVMVELNDMCVCAIGLSYLHHTLYTYVMHSKSISSIFVSVLVNFWKLKITHIYLYHRQYCMPFHHQRHRNTLWLTHWLTYILKKKYRKQHFSQSHIIFALQV